MTCKTPRAMYANAFPQHEYDFHKVVTPSKVPTRLVALRYAHSAKLALSIYLHLHFV